MDKKPKDAKKKEKVRAEILKYANSRRPEQNNEEITEIISSDQRENIFRVAERARNIDQIVTDKRNEYWMRETQRRRNERFDRARQRINEEQKEEEKKFEESEEEEKSIVSEARDYTELFDHDALQEAIANEEIFLDVLENTTPQELEIWKAQRPIKTFVEPYRQYVEGIRNLDVVQAIEEFTDEHIEDPNQPFQWSVKYQIWAGLRFYLWYKQNNNSAKLHSKNIWTNLDLFLNPENPDLMWYNWQNFIVRAVRLQEQEGSIDLANRLREILLFERGTLAYLLKFLIELKKLTIENVVRWYDTFVVEEVLEQLSIDPLMPEEPDVRHLAVWGIINNIIPYARCVKWVKLSFVNEARIWQLFSRDYALIDDIASRELARIFDFRLKFVFPYFWADVDVKENGEFEWFDGMNNQADNMNTVRETIATWIMKIGEAYTRREPNRGQNVERKNTDNFRVRWNFVFGAITEDMIEKRPSNNAEEDRHMTSQIHWVHEIPPNVTIDQAREWADAIEQQMLERLVEIIRENQNNYDREADSVEEEEDKEEIVPQKWRLKQINIFVAQEEPPLGSTFSKLETYVKMNQALNLAPQLYVYCRKSNRTWRDFITFSNVTDRLCVYEVYHHLKHEEMWNTLWKYWCAEKKREIIYKDFVNEDSELQVDCVAGDIYKVWKEHLTERCNLFYWDVGVIGDSVWDPRKEFTLLVKQAHVCMVRTMLAEQKLALRKDLTWKSTTTAGKFILSPKKPIERKDSRQMHWIWDIETCRCPTTNQMVPYLCVVSELGNEKDMTLSFEGIDCLEKMLNFINNLVNQDYKNGKSGNIQPIQHFIWGFNSHRFDLIFLLPSIIKTFNDVQLRGSMTKVKKLVVANVEFCDIWAINPTGSLADMVKAWLPNTEYKKQELDHKMITTLNWKEWIEEALPYCINDVVITGKLVQKWLDWCDELKIKPNQTSCSSYAVAVFRTHYLKDTLEGLTYHDYERIKTSYCGGINWVLAKKMKAEVGYCYDFNSCYPFAMTKPLPVEWTGYQPGLIKVSSRDFKILNPNWLYHVSKFKWVDSWKDPFFMKKDEEGIACFPHSYESQEFLSIWGETLLLALKEELIEGDIVIQGVDMFRSEAIFKDFMDEHYSKRLNSQTAFEKQQLKLIMNNLYGKLGQKLYRDKIYVTSEMAEFILKSSVLQKRVYNMVKPKDGIYEIEFDDYSFASNIGGMIFIASKVTDSARCQLMALNIYIKKYRNMNTFYFDTDSCFTDCQLPETDELYDKLGLPNPLVDDKTLGCMKCEYSFTKAIWIAKKIYCVEEPDGKLHAKMKGVPNKLVVKSKEETWKVYEDLYKDSKFNVTLIDVFLRKLGNVTIKNVEKVIRMIDRRKFISEYESEPL